MSRRARTAGARMLVRVLPALLLIAGCNSDDALEPKAGQFRATISGAESRTLSGTTYAARVYSEADPATRVTIFMSGSTSFSGNRVITIDCPASLLFTVGTYQLQSTSSGCRGGYRLQGATPDDPFVQELISTQGTVTITSASTSAVAGSFQFSGPLMTGSTNAGNATASGNFNSTRFQQ